VTPIATVVPQPKIASGGLSVSSVWTAGTGVDSTAWRILTGLLESRDQPPKALIGIYRAAGRRYRLPWQLLAAINAIETDYGLNVRTSPTGAVGIMQFLPSTWREYAVDADRHARLSAYDRRDAIFTAARMLVANGAHRHLRRAIYEYNHSRGYVMEVLDVAQAIVDRTARPGAGARQKLNDMLTTARLLNGDAYIWGGGHNGWAPASGYDCSGFVSAVLHAAGYLTEPAYTQTLPAGRGIGAGVGRWVTIFDRTDGGGLQNDHVIIEIKGQWWESGGTPNAGVHRMTPPDAAYLATFNRVLHPKGL
jgi:cell wall-associated NlpC family hydrolase